ncbi:MAG: tRNA lysidine(34) synthetase TilS [Puniceicoccales bacterium]|nr:tRNA lysidine(34) synthetase TilS [Puniceicoccales bacterium]
MATSPFLSPSVISVLRCSSAVICVACSGGSDSVALLRLLCDSDLQRDRLHVLHFDHGVRPTTSKRDRIFVEDLCAQLHVFFHCGYLQNAANCNEAALRHHRMSFFHGMLAELSTPYLLTAHQRDDVLETLLLRLARGSSLEGLVAPRERQCFRGGIIHLKPLLNISKVDLANYLRAIGQEWCKDETNGQLDHTRNRVRLELLPLWKTFEPERNFEASILRTRVLLLEDAEALGTLSEQLLERAQSGRQLALAPLQDAPKAILRRTLHLFFSHHGHVIGREQMEIFLRHVQTQQPCCVAINTSVQCICDGCKIMLS